MKIKECKEYFNHIIESFESASKKNKLFSALFVILVGLLCLIPFVCIFINLYMQFLGIKVAMAFCIAICGIIVHLLLSLLYPVYYLCLNELCKDENVSNKLSYKRLFIALVSDLFMIIFITVIVIVLIIIVNYVFF